MTDLLTPVEIYLAKCSKVLLPTANVGPGGNVDAGKDSQRATVATIAKNVQSLGFGLSDSLLESLSSSPNPVVVDWYRDVYPALQKMVGADRDFAPTYPNFPQQVMDVSDAELYFNAMTHYFWAHAVGRTG